jgi:hypothetical protein
VLTRSRDDHVCDGDIAAYFTRIRRDAGAARGRRGAACEDSMSQHKYVIGQSVEFLPGPRDGNAPGGRYKVQRLMPSETRDLQYRVKHTVDGHERVVLESQLAAGRI